MLLYLVLCLLPFPPSNSEKTSALKPNVVIGSKYRKEVGVARVGKPIRILKTTRSIACAMQCNDLKDCRSFNAIYNRTGLNQISCEFFDTLLKSQIKVKAEKSAYYEIFINERDCLDIIRKGYSYYNDNSNRIYQLALPMEGLISAACDMHTDEGGWTLLQRRFNGSVDFYRDWESYKNGFGDLKGEFWFGLENAHLLMKGTDNILRFDLWNGTDHYYQEYCQAMISNETLNYQLTFDGASGTAGDSMSAYSKDRMFTTKDKDNDGWSITNCASAFHGAWWYSSCHHANLNGMYGSISFGEGMNWFSLTGHYYSLTKTEIKVRRIP